MKDYEFYDSKDIENAVESCDFKSFERIVLRQDVCGIDVRRVATLICKHIVFPRTWIRLLTSRQRMGELGLFTNARKYIAEYWPIQRETYPERKNSSRTEDEAITTFKGLIVKDREKLFGKLIKFKYDMPVVREVLLETLRNGRVHMFELLAKEYRMQFGTHMFNHIANYSFMQEFSRMELGFMDACNVIRFFSTYDPVLDFLKKNCSQVNIIKAAMQCYELKKSFDWASCLYDRGEFTVMKQLYSETYLTVKRYDFDNEQDVEQMLKIKKGIRVRINNIPDVVCDIISEMTY